MRVTVFRDYPEEGFTSMEVYADNLIGALKERKLSPEIKEYLPLNSLSKKLGYLNLKTRFFFRYFIYPIFALFHQGEINHVIDQTYGHLVYFLNHKKTVVTVHDLDVLRLKFLEWKTPRDKIIRWAYLFSVSGLRKAAKIIAVSSDTKNDLIRFLKIPPQKIEIIPEGVEPIFKEIKDKNRLMKIREKYCLPEKFILHVGTCWANKNIEGILDVFSELTKNKELGDLFLVKVGSDWTEDQKKLIKKLGITNRVIKLPFIPKDELPAIYNLAKALVQLSFLEGFGLTVLEAMACGCPVVVSNIPALKELVGEAGVIVDLEKKKEIVKKIANLITRESSCQWYAQRGIARAKFFRWEKTAEKTLKIYEEVIKE